MIPLLFTPDETAYTTHGLGPVVDATNCLVTEEANGAFTLQMTVPAGTKRLAALVEGNQILAAVNPADRPQPFRIKRVSKTLTGALAVYAQHVAYDLGGLVLAPFTAASAADAVSKFNTYRLSASPFAFETDITLSNPFALAAPDSAWARLGGGENTLLYNYGGALKFDRYTVSLLASRGADRGFAIRYGKNMTSLQCETDASDLYTGVLPYWTDGETVVTGSIQSAAGSYGYAKVMPLDLTDQFPDTPTANELNAAGAAYIAEHNIGVPRVAIRCGFVPPGARGLMTLEDLRLFDEVAIEHESLGITLKAHVVKTVYDSLRERYQSMDIGNRLISVAQTIAAPVTAEKIAPGAVTASAMGRNSVKQDSLISGSVLARALANASVTTPKIAGGAVTTAKTSTGINTSLGWADFWSNVYYGNVSSQWIKCTYLKVGGSWEFTPTAVAYMGTDGTAKSRVLLAAT